jgi:hypothetical protein
VSRGAEGSSGRAFVGELTEDKAVELAGKVVSEGFIYTVSLYNSFLQKGDVCLRRRTESGAHFAVSFLGETIKREEHVRLLVIAPEDWSLLCVWQCHVPSLEQAGGIQITRVLGQQVPVHNHCLVLLITAVLDWLCKSIVSYFVQMKCGGQLEPTNAYSLSGSSQP